MNYIRPEHQIIAGVLRGMNEDLLVQSKSWFGGGTAIVMTHGEYRRSLGLDFLCSSMDGYRLLREAFFTEGHRALFDENVKLLRDVRADQHGIRMAVELEGQHIKIEIVRESRIDLEGIFDTALGVPTLNTDMMFAEKLLANADRCQDRAVAYRDAIDLGRLVLASGEIPAEAIAVAENAYGNDISRKVKWVTNHLLDENMLRPAAEAMNMEFAVAKEAICFLRKAAAAAWPAIGIIEDPDDSVKCDA